MNPNRYLLMETKMESSRKVILQVVSLAVLLFTGAGLATDHLDSQATSIDPLADLLDLYAFNTPMCGPGTPTVCEDEPEELILALTLNPFASGGDQFPDDVLYHFFLENDSGITSQIDCSFSHDQVITCEGPGGMVVQSRVGEIGAQGDLRVFAGLRDDPFFFDLAAFADFDTVGINAFQSPGTDFFAGSNVLAIVIGIRISAIPAGSGYDTNIQKIWAASERTGGDGLNGAISGSWYNPTLDGQGWLVEVIRLPNGQDKFVVYFYGYEFGEQVWLVGSSDIVGNTATVDMVRTSGAEWGNAFNKDDVIRDVIGTMAFEFLDCDHANVSYTPGDTRLTAFSTSMQRLTNIASLDCSLLTAGQVDRVGRPLASMLFVPEEIKDTYNTASDPGTWTGLFTDAFVASIGSLDLADGVAGNLLGGDAQALASLFVDDRLQIDLKQPACTDYGAIEMATLAPGVVDGCGGRSPFYDVVDDTLNVVVSGFEMDIEDNIDENDATFLAEFPFLAPPSGPSKFVSSTWLESTPPEQGLDTALVQSLLEDAETIDHLYCVLVAKNGYLVAEKYFNGMDSSDANSVASVTKSFMSALLGIALTDHVLTSLDQKMVDFFPEIDWGNNDPRKSEITLRQILQMRSGYPWEEFAGLFETLINTSDWIGLLEEFPLSSNPGTQFGYSNLTAHMTSYILERAAGMSTLAFAKANLFDPLGIADGYYYVNGGFQVTPRDMAKFGQLYLDKGLFSNTRVIPENWVTESLQPYSFDTYGQNIVSTFGPLDYGYLWWSSSAGSHDFSYAWGHGGQLIVLVHELDMIIVTTASDLPGQPGNISWPKERSILEMVGKFIALIP
jgi:CubicO group peptidase (beta-lactamase class C family)